MNRIVIQPYCNTAPDSSQFSRCFCFFATLRTTHT